MDNEELLNMLSYSKEVAPIPYAKTLTINNAPTADQARFLKQLEEQAWKTITDKLITTIPDNKLSSITVSRYLLPEHMQEAVTTMFTLNGERYEFQVKAHPGNRDPIQEIYEGIAARIAVELMGHMKR